MRVRRRRREPRPRPRQAALRSRARQRAAALRLAGERRRVHDAAHARRPPFLGLDLAHGGHLTHGHKLNFSGKLYRVVGYQVRPRHRDRRLRTKLEATALREKPRMIIGGGSAYPRQFDFARMRSIADKVGAYFVVDMAHFAGLVAGGVHPSPVPHAHIVHHHHAQNPPRPPRRNDPLANSSSPPESTAASSLASRGGPLVHIVAAKAVAFREALQPEFAVYAAQDRRQTPKVLRRSHGRRRLPHHLRRHRHPPHPGRRLPERASSAARPSTHSARPASPSTRTPIPYDTNPPMKPSGHPHRHPRAHHPRHEGSRNAHHRQVDRRSSRASQRTPPN